MKRSCPRGSFSVSDFKIFTQRQTVTEIEETVICAAEEADQNAVEQGADEGAGSDSFEMTESEEEKGHQYLTLSMLRLRAALISLTHSS